MDQYQFFGQQQKDQIKINTFRRKEKRKKKCVKNFGWAVKNGPKGIYYLFFGNDLTKTPETKKTRKG